MKLVKRLKKNTAGTMQERARSQAIDAEIRQRRKLTARSRDDAKGMEGGEKGRRVRLGLNDGWEFGTSEKSRGKKGGCVERERGTVKGEN